MIKGLEALERIKLVYQCTDMPIIEKELKTLAIISRYFYSEHIIHDLYCLGATDEEIALAREVLKE
jgi:hypothetical protein